MSDEQPSNGAQESSDSQELSVELGIVEFPELLAYVVEGTGLNVEGVHDLLASAIDTVFEAGVPLTGPPMIRYLDIPEGEEGFTNVTAQVLIPLDADGAATAGLEQHTLPPLGMVASARYRGPLEARPQIYSELFDFIQQYQFGVNGLPLELFWEHREDGSHLIELICPVMDLLPPGSRQWETDASPAVEEE